MFDDMLIFSTDQLQVDKTKMLLSSKFSMKDLGEADVILGIRIIRENKGLIMTQSHYVEKILKRILLYIKEKMFGSLYQVIGVMIKFFF